MFFLIVSLKKINIWPEMTNIVKKHLKMNYFVQNRGLQAPAAFLPTTASKQSVPKYDFLTKKWPTRQKHFKINYFVPNRGLQAPAAFRPTPCRNLRFRRKFFGRFFSENSGRRWILKKTIFKLSPTVFFLIVFKHYDDSDIGLRKTWRHLWRKRHWVRACVMIKTVKK